jgi:hypothetical protein
MPFYKEPHKTKLYGKLYISHPQAEIKRLAQENVKLFKAIKLIEGAWGQQSSPPTELDADRKLLERYEADTSPFAKLSRKNVCRPRAPSYLPGTTPQNVFRPCRKASPNNNPLFYVH